MASDTDTPGARATARRVARPVAASFLLAAAFAPPAGAQQRSLELVSGGTSDHPVEIRAVSADGGTTVFETREPLAAADTDDADDLYARSAAGLRLVSGGTADVGVLFRAITPDGRRIFFDTVEPLVPEDQDDEVDLYARIDDRLVKVSPRSGDHPASFQGMTPDGSLVYIETAERLSPTQDSNDEIDTYEIDANGRVRLISVPRIGHEGEFAGVAAGGDRVFFETRAPLDPLDGDGAWSDVYERRRDGSVRLVSGGTEDEHATFFGASADGTRVYFETYEPLLPAQDGDSARDVYERRANGSLRLVTGDGDGFDATARGLAADGRTLFFTTLGRLDAGDTDSRADLYEAGEDGTIRRVSSGDAEVSVRFVGASDDGRRVYWSTEEQVVPGDTDTRKDVYETTDAGPRLVTGGGAEHEVTPEGVSADGSRLLFRTREPLDPADGDVAYDLYEAHDGRISLVTPGTGDVHVQPGPAFTPDLRHVAFTTFERLLPADTDNARDAYAVVPAPPVSAPPAPAPPRPAPAPPVAAPAFPAAPSAPGRPDDDAARRRTRPRPVAARLLSRRPSRPGVVRVRVACPRGAGVRRCRGTVRLTTVRRFALRGGRRGVRRRALTLGRARFSVRAGRSGVVRVRLSRRGRARLARSRRLRVRVTTVIRDASGGRRTTSRRATLRAARRR